MSEVMLTDKQITMFDLLSKPSQMQLWSDPKKIIDFLRIQAHFYEAGSAWGSSTIAMALNRCADSIEDEMIKEQHD